MYLDLLAFHGQDVNKSKVYQEEVDNCYTSYWEEQFVANLNTLRARKDTAGKNHLNGRQWIRDSCPGHTFESADWTTGSNHVGLTEHDTDHSEVFGSLIQQASAVALELSPVVDPSIDHCQIYDDYRQNNLAALLTTAPQNCAPAHLQDDYIKAEGNPMLGEMEDCLEHVKLWLDPLYELMEACQRVEGECNDKAKESMGNQSLFEYETCEYNTIVRIKCGGYDDCFGGVLSRSASECGNIQTRAAARQADNETAERIKCLLGVLMVDDDATKVDEEGTESKADKLAACKTVDYEDYNKFWQIECPVWEADGEPVPEYPPGIDCMADRFSPCDGEFLEEEYRSKLDLDRWEADRPLTELNQQFGQCKPCLPL